jgi:hypothetical protein
VRTETLLPTPLGGYNDIKSGDLNGDGYADLALLSGQGLTHSYVYYNDGTQDLSQATEIIANPENGVSLGTLGIGDFNGDGRSDLAVMRDRTEVSMFEQTKDGILDAAGVLSTDWDPNAMVGSDLDGNGKADLIIVHGGGGLGVFYQQDDGVLQAEVLYPGLYATRLKPQGLAVGDINNDGCKDVAIANYNYGLVTYLGSGCVERPDLFPSLGLTKNFITLRVDNAGNAAANDTHAALMLSVTNGSLAIGELPSGCSLADQSDRSAQLDCSYGGMAEGTSETRTLSFMATGGDLRNAVVARAGVSTTSAESRADNNSASKRLMLEF